MKPLESKKVKVTFQQVKDKILFILQAFSEFTFEPSSGELKPLESKKAMVTFQLALENNILFILQAFSELTFEPNGRELKPLKK